MNKNKKNQMMKQKNAHLFHLQIKLKILIKGKKLKKLMEFRHFYDTKTRQQDYKMIKNNMKKKYLVVNMIMRNTKHIRSHNHSNYQHTLIQNKKAIEKKYFFFIIFP